MYAYYVFESFSAQVFMYALGGRTSTTFWPDFWPLSGLLNPPFFTRLLRLKKIGLCGIEIHTTTKWKLNRIKWSRMVYEGKQLTLRCYLSAHIGTLIQPQLRLKKKEPDSIRTAAADRPSFYVWASGNTFRTDKETPNQLKLLQKTMEISFWYVFGT